MTAIRLGDEFYDREVMEKVLQTWLSHQCRMLSGVVQAVLLTGPPDIGPYNKALFWPDKRCNHDALVRVARAALRNKQTVIKTRNNRFEKTGEPLDAVACPLLFSGKLFGVVAIEMTHRSQSMQKATLRQVQAGVKWLETIIRLQGSTAKKQLVNLVDLVAAGLEHEQFRVAAAEVTNELAERFSCQRVSLGFLRYNRVRIEALSHSSRIDQNSNMIRTIRNAMSESIDQATTVVYPVESDDAPLVTRFHAELAKAQQGAPIAFPFFINGKVQIAAPCWALASSA